MRLPPWGLLPEPLRPMLSGEPMGDWPGDAAAYRAFYDHLTGEIADVIWPIHDPRTGGWTGAAAAFADEATADELSLMVEEYSRSDILAQAPDYDTQVPESLRRTHLWHFRIEDRLALPDTDPDARYARTPVSDFAIYEPGIDPDTFGKTFLDPARARRKIHGLFDLKPLFARPRPFQAALVLGVEGFKWEIAAPSTHTGLHPSLISGHALQGLMLSAMVLEHWLAQGPVDETRIARLAQFGADLGDRRVFAGVHYPSDNIASWITALRLIPLLYTPADVILAFALDLITTRSAVYRMIRQHFPQSPSLSAALALLDTQIERSRNELDRLRAS